MRAYNYNLEKQEFAWLVASAANLFKIPINLDILFNQTPPPYSLNTLSDVFAKLSIDTSLVELRSKTSLSSKVRLPAIGFINKNIRNERMPAVNPEIMGGAPVDTMQGRTEELLSSAVAPAIIIAIENDTLHYFTSGEQRQQSCKLSDIDELFSSTFINIRHIESVSDPDVQESTKQARFGFRWFVPELLKHKSIFRDIILATAVLMILGLGIPLLTQTIFDKVVVHQTMSTLSLVASALAVILVFNAVMGWLRQYLIIHTGNRIDAVLGDKVFRQLVRLPMFYFNHRPTGTIMARLNGIETIREFLTGAAITLILDFPFLIILVAVMFFYSWELTLIALGGLSALTLTSLVVMPMYRERLNQQFIVGARNQAFVTEHVAGIETVKALQMEPTLERQYGNYLNDFLTANVRTKSLGNTYQITSTTLEQLQTGVILIVGALIVMRHEGFTIGMLIAFQMFAARLAQPMMRLASLYQEFQQAHIAVARLGDIMNCPTEPYSLVPSRHNDVKGHIEIQGLSFRYSENDPYLYRNLTISIPAGKVVAVMGPSGSGKSTLAKLLQGFAQPSEGRIRIDGIDIAHLSANELRSQMGVVPQTTVLFSGTIHDNLMVAYPQATFDDVVLACKAAGIHDYIEQLPKGYQAVIGERGIGLSGGQQQRLAIARALLKRPKILVFDEATSSLDPSTAEQIAMTLNQLKGSVTVLFIAHQLPRGLSADYGVSLNRVSNNAQVKVSSNSDTA